MKQYTTPEQTAKLMELGFEKPGSIASVEPIYGMGGISVAKAYSIGELIAMLREQIEQIADSGIPCDLKIHYDDITWLIEYICARDGRIKVERIDLVNALYGMLVKLKEEGVI
jgi:hypothetical protein